MPKRLPSYMTPQDRHDAFTRFEGDHVRGLQVLLNDLVRDSLNVPYPLQQSAADFIASAYRTQPVGTLSLPVPASVSEALAPHVQGAALDTVADLENVILRSQYASMAKIGKKLLNGTNPRIELGDAMSEAVLASREQFATFDPTQKTSITQWLELGFRSSLTNLDRSNAARGPSLSTLEQEISTDEYGNEILSREASVTVDLNGRVHGAMAGYRTGPAATWQEQLLGQMEGNVVLPTGLWTKGNPNNPFYVNGQFDPSLTNVYSKRQGLQQVRVTDTQLQEFFHAPQPFTQQDAAIARMVEKELRRLGANMQGRETVGGNAIGDNMQMLDAELMAQPEGVLEVRDAPLAGIRSRSLETIGATALPGSSEFNAYAAVDGLAMTPTQKLAAAMAEELRLKGFIAKGFPERYKARLEASIEKLDEWIGNSLQRDGVPDQVLVNRRKAIMDELAGLKAENKTGYLDAVHALDDVQSWAIENGPVPSDVPPEYADAYRKNLLEGLAQKGMDQAVKGSGEAGSWGASGDMNEPPMEGSTVRPPNPMWKLDGTQFNSATEYMNAVRAKYATGAESQTGGAMTDPEQARFGNYEEPSDAGNSPVSPPSERGVTSVMSASDGRTYIEAMHPEFVTQFLGTGTTRLAEFDAYRAAMSPEKRKMFDEAWGAVRAEHVQARNSGEAKSVWSKWTADNGGWRGETAHATPGVSTPPPAMAPVDPASQAFIDHNAGVASRLGTMPIPRRTSEINFDEDPQGGELMRTPVSQHATAQLMGDWMARAANIDINGLGRFQSSKIGSFQATDMENGRAASGHIMAGNTETLSEGNTQKAAEWGRSATETALAKGGYEGLNSTSAVATFQARFSDAINKLGEQYVKEMGGKDPNLQASAKLTAARILEASKDLGQSFAEGMRGDLNQSGNVYDSRFNTVKPLGRDVNAIKAMMAANPEFAAVINGRGGAEAAAAGPRFVDALGNDSFDTGGEGYSGSGSGSSGSSKHKSLYQTDPGRAMMGLYMTQMAWDKTAGAVIKEADAYGTSQANMAPLMAYGDDSAVGTASAYAAQKAKAAEYSGSLAYQSFGMFTNAGYTFGGGPMGNGLIQMGQALGVTAGVGALGMGAAYGASLMGLGSFGALAGPVAGIAGTGVGLPVLGMAGYNALTGQTPDEGLSFKNTLRGLAMRNAEVAQNPLDVEAQFGLISREGSKLSQYFGTHFQGQSETEVIRSGLGLLDNWFPNLAVELTGPTQKQKDLQSLVQGLSDKTQQKQEDVSKQLVPIQSMLGGLDTATKKDTASRLVTLSQDTGLDQTSIASQLGGARGFAPGSDEFNDLVKSYLNQGDNNLRNSFVLEQRHEVQGFSQYAPYMEGTTLAAGQLYTQLGMNMPRSQNFAQVAAGVANSQGFELTQAQAANLGQISIGLGKYSTPFASMAGQLDQMGVGNYEQNYTQLAGMVQAGGEPQNLKELVSGNRYAWSDYGREQGIGKYQITQATGLQAGTTDMSGVLMYSRQEQLKQPGLTDRQTLAALGVSDVGYQDALLRGGSWAAEDLHNQRVRDLTQQSFALQGSQLASNAAYTDLTWGLQQQSRKVSWTSEQFGFGQSQKQLNLSNQFFDENLNAARSQSQLGNQYQNQSSAFNYQTQLMQRGFAREDYNYQQQMNSLQYGWGMEDINEQIRRSSRYERAQLIKQRGRMTTTEGLQSEHAEQGMENQEALWKRQDEQYQKQLEYTKKLQEQDEERFEREKRQHDAMAGLDQENLAERIKTATEMHKLETKMQEAQHRHDLEQLDFSRQNLEIQKAVSAEQVAYQKTLTVTQRQVAQMAADFQRLVGYLPAFRDAVQEMFDTASHPSSPGGSFSLQR